MHNIDLDELLKFIKLEQGRLRARYGVNDDTQKWALKQTVKLGEEFGELCDAVLSGMGSQRNSKIYKELEAELADNLIVLLLLADSLDIDIKKALVNKIKVVNSRYH
ncbi:MAG: hypothetical protein MUF85_02985 [Patescibacteria group bacterium]|jgi:NTP pyrophosphatase (non-canonical NTP hydrolase)|nr:hypothetical protein [Patescibacteria group bacterium]